MKGRTFLLSSALVILVGCGGGGGGGGETISGVWEGSYTEQLSTLQTKEAQKGPICLEISQNGAQVSGKAWVSGYLWGEGYSGTVSGNTFTGQVSGQDLGGHL